MIRLCLRALGTAFFLGAASAPTLGHTQDAASYALADGRVVSPLDAFQECDRCPDMIVMPLGSFMMGAIRGESRNPFDWHGENATGRVRMPGEINIMPSEHPRHRVEINVPYAMGRNEVTHAEWMACVADGGCTHNPEHKVLTLRGEVTLGPDHPVINVSYLDALEYVAWLNGLVGEAVYRLPTEAEWEYAARAGTQTRFAQGDELTVDQANFSRAATENLRQFERPEGMPELLNRDQPVPVDALDASNAWGLRHMSGNVREVTQSCWTPAQLGLATSRQYLNLAQSQQGCRRVAKGGAFTSAMDSVRLAKKSRPTETTRRHNRGFRVIRIFPTDGSFQ